MGSSTAPSQSPHNPLEVLVLVLAICGWLGCVPGEAQTWAVGAAELTTCPTSPGPQRFPSADGSATVEVSCRNSTADEVPRSSS